MKLATRAISVPIPGPGIMDTLKRPLLSVRPAHAYRSERTRSRTTTASFPATFMRGGTSNGLLIKRDDLPPEIDRWRPILSSAMGSPDVYGRQLNGMGSGISSTSKICVVERSSRPGIDVDYTFVQLGIKDGSLDMAGNCGNMSSAVGPFAMDEGLFSPGTSLGDDGEVTVRMFNTNTSKVIHSTFRASLDGALVAEGDYSIDGIPGTGSRITLSFLNPGGAKTGVTLPTNNAIDTLQTIDGFEIRATVTDIANPGVFVLASDLNLAGDIHPDALSADFLAMVDLEHLRRAGAAAMGLNPEVQSVPKIVMLSPPTSEQAQEGVNIVCRALSMQQAHKAVPLTLALNLGAACRMPGTLPAQVAAFIGDGDSITIAHASGRLEVGSTFKNGRVESALLHRTARTLMRGEVFYNISG